MEIALTIFLILLYFTPSFVAFFRKKRNSLAIFFLNLFLGWTFLAWVAALIWASTFEEK